MAEPPTVVFGPSTRNDMWWALLPAATAAIYHNHVGRLIAEVERLMTSHHPGRPFGFALDPVGSREPGALVGIPDRGSAARRVLTVTWDGRPAPSQ